MCHDGVLAVHDSGVVAALVEHSHIHSEDVGEIYRSRHSALVGADDHEMIVVQSEIRHVLHQSLQELIGGEEIVESVQRNGVLNTGIVSVESDKVGNAHIAQFLECQGAVQRFSLGAAVLASLIQEGHDHIDPVSLAGGSGYDPLQILIMVVRDIWLTWPQTVYVSL